MPDFSLVTAVSNMAGVNNRTPHPASPYLNPPNTRFISVTSHSLWPCPPHTHTHTQLSTEGRQKTANKVLFNGSPCLKRKESTRKGDPFKVQPGAPSWTTRGRFIVSLSLLSGRMTRTRDIMGNLMWPSLFFKFNLFFFLVSWLENWVVWGLLGCKSQKEKRNSGEGSDNYINK